MFGQDFWYYTDGRGAGWGRGIFGTVRSKIRSSVDRRVKKCLMHMCTQFAPLSKTDDRVWAGVGLSRWKKGKGGWSRAPQIRTYQDKTTNLIAAEVQYMCPSKVIHSTCSVQTLRS